MIQRVFEQFKELTVLIIGDLMVDSYIWGNVSRISPEAPVPIVDVKEREIRLGGAGNVALNIKSLGAKPILCSLIGEDKDAEGLIALFKDEGLSTEGLIASPERPTTVKHRIISGGQHLLRVDSETTAVHSSNEFIELKTKLDDLIAKCDVIIMEDYDKGVFSKELIQFIVKKAKQKGIATIVDPKKRNFLNFREVSLFKPNLKELKEGLKIDFNVSDFESLKDAIKLLVDKMKIESALITLSERGMMLYVGDEFYHCPAHIRKIADVSGAGDTVVSVSALCKALNLSPQFSVELANLSGGLVCEHVGVVPIDKDALYNEAQKNNLGKLL